MTELDKLERYLKNNNIDYTRIDDGGVKMDTSIGEVTVGERHQIIVDDWDVICQPNSYGYKDGLLELAGSLVKPELDGDVEGWLTANDIISRLNKIPSKEIIIEIDKVVVDSDGFDMFHVKGTDTVWLTKGQLDKLLMLNHIQKGSYYERIYNEVTRFNK